MSNYVKLTGAPTLEMVLQCRILPHFCPQKKLPLEPSGPSGWLQGHFLLRARHVSNTCVASMSAVCVHSTVSNRFTAWV